MKFNMSVLLFVFSFVSLSIAIFQFISDGKWEIVLSLIYSVMFFTGGMIYRSQNKKAEK